MEEREILQPLIPVTDFDKLMVSEAINRELKGLIRVMERLSQASSTRLRDAATQLNQAEAELIQLRKDFLALKKQKQIQSNSPLEGFKSFIDALYKRVKKQSITATEAIQLIGDAINEYERRHHNLKSNKR